MAGIQFQYTWHDDSKNAIRYTALGEWTWRDYHACVQIASFSLAGHEGIHSIIDFRQQTRPKMPGGMIAHMRTFGKKIVPALSGHAIVVGMPEETLATLQRNDDGTMDAVDGTIYFVDDDAGIEAQLAQFKQI
jgi:hypothetical protein